MLVGDASLGQILCAENRVPFPYTRNFSEEDLATCSAAGFVPGFLMPSLSSDGAFIQQKTLLLYVGPVYLKKAIGGLKKHHLFLHEGQTVGIEGYDFRHLEPLQDV